MSTRHRLRDGFEYAANTRYAFRDYITDFLGSLLPGFVFLVFLFPSIVAPLLTLIHSIKGTKIADPLSGDQIIQVVKLFRFEIFITFMSLSYVIGQIFHRQDPKLPDNWSYFSLPKEVKKESAVQIENVDESPKPGFLDKKIPILYAWRVKRKLKIEKHDLIEFPYSHLKHYLNRRGMNHLTKNIYWENDSKEKIKAKEQNIL